MQRGLDKVPDTPTPYNNSSTSFASQQQQQFKQVPTSLRPIRSTRGDAMRAPYGSASTAAAGQLPASPGVSGINMDVSMESDRQPYHEPPSSRAKRAGVSFDENSPRYGSAPMRSHHNNYERQPSKMAAHVSEESTDEDTSGSLRIRLQHPHRSPKPPSAAAAAAEPKSPAYSAFSSPARPSYKSITHDSPVSGFDGMAKELRREFERITNGQNKHLTANMSSIQSPVPPSKQRSALGDLSNNYSAAAAPSPSSARSYHKPSETTKQASLYDSPQKPYKPSAKDSVFDASPARPQQQQTTRAHYAMPDVTGLTEGLATPQKAFNYRKLAPESHHSSSESGSHLRDALHDLEAKLNSLEDENYRSTRRIEQLENELQHQSVARQGDKSHVHDSALGTNSSERQASGTRHDLTGLPQVNSHAGARSHMLEDLVERLHAHVARLTKSLNTHGDALEELKEGTSSRPDLDVLRRQMHSYDDQVSTLRSSVEALSHEINEVRMLVEGLVQKQQTPLGHPPSTGAAAAAAAAEMPRSFKQQRSDPELQSTHTASLRPSGLHPGATHSGHPYERPVSAPPMDTHHHYQQQPQLRPRREPAANDPELQRAEAILRSMPGQHQDDMYCSTCHHVPRHRYPAPSAGPSSREALWSHNSMPRRRAAAAVPEDEGFAEYVEDDTTLPPQTLLSRALRELEVDFSTHRNIYIELSEAYRKIDPASNASKRHALAGHLKESVDSLETKADEIKRLYDLLHYSDPKRSNPAYPAAF